MRLKPRVDIHHIIFKDLQKETRFLLGYAIAYTCIGFGIGWLILHYPLPILGAGQFNQDLWYTGLYKIGLLLLVPSFVYAFVWKYRYKDLLYGWKPNPLNIAGMILLVAAGFFLNAAHLHKLRSPLQTDHYAWRMMLGIMMPLFTAALPEELFFRAYLQTRLEKLSRSPLVAILITSLLFTAWHLPSRYLLSHGVEGQAGNWLAVFTHTGIPVFIISVLLGSHWIMRRNIIALILVHWAIDILPSISSYFGISY